MGQTLSERVKAILNTPGTNELAQISELNTNFNKLDNHFIPGCKMTFTGSQDIETNSSGTAETSDYNNTLFDSFAARGEGAMADLANNKIIIRRTGIYVISAASGFVANATGVRRIDLYIDGVALLTEDRAAKASGVTTVGLHTIELLTAGAEIQTKLVQNSGVTLAVSANGVARGVFLAVGWLGAGVEV